MRNVKHQTRRAGEAYRRAIQLLVDEGRLPYVPEPFDLTADEAIAFIKSASDDPDHEPVRVVQGTRV